MDFPHLHVSQINKPLNMKILLIHQYAGNKGDRAVAFAICNLIKSIDPTIEITISTSSPELWENEPYYMENSIKFITNSWDFSKASPRYYWSFIQKVEKYTFTILRTLYLRYGQNNLCKWFINPAFRKAVKESDLVISVGGHHFTTLLSRDLVSSINYDAMSVLSMGKPLVCFSQSFGHFKFHNPKNEQLTKKILTNCKLLLPREAKATDDLKLMGVPDNLIKATYESVITLNSLITDYVIPSKRNKRVGIAIYATQKREPTVHANYVQSIVDTCNHINSQGYEVRFFPMELKGTGPDDRILIKEITDKVQNPEMVMMYDEDMTTADHIREVAKCQIFIGHKTHSTIFSMATGTPLVGIAYHVKTREFMKQFDCEEYCIDDDKLTSHTLITTFDHILPNIDDVGSSLFAHAKEMSDVIKKDMRTVLSNE